MTQVSPDITLPVPAETIALLRMPIALGALSPLIAWLNGAYGDELVIRTDTGIQGWMVLAATTWRPPAVANSGVEGQQIVLSTDTEEATRGD